MSGDEDEEEEGKRDNPNFCFFNYQQVSFGNMLDPTSFVDSSHSSLKSFPKSNGRLSHNVKPFTSVESNFHERRHEEVSLHLATQHNPQSVFIANNFLSTQNQRFMVPFSSISKDTYFNDEFKTDTLTPIEPILIGSLKNRNNTMISRDALFDSPNLSEQTIPLFHSIVPSFLFKNCHHNTNRSGGHDVNVCSSRSSLKRFKDSQRRDTLNDKCLLMPKRKRRRYFTKKHLNLYCSNLYHHFFSITPHIYVIYDIPCDHCHLYHEDQLIQGDWDINIFTRKHFPYKQQSIVIIPDDSLILFLHCHSLINVLYVKVSSKILDILSTQMISVKPKKSDMANSDVFCTSFHSLLSCLFFKIKELYSIYGLHKNLIILVSTLSKDISLKRILSSIKYFFFNHLITISNDLHHLSCVKMITQLSHIYFKLVKKYHIFISFVMFPLPTTIDIFHHNLFSTVCSLRYSQSVSFYNTNFFPIVYKTVPKLIACINEEETHHRLQTFILFLTQYIPIYFNFVPLAFPLLTSSMNINNQESHHGNRPHISSQYPLLEKIQQPRNNNIYPMFLANCWKPQVLQTDSIQTMMNNLSQPLFTMSTSRLDFDIYERHRIIDNQHYKNTRLSSIQPNEHTSLFSLPPMTRDLSSIINIGTVEFSTDDIDIHDACYSESLPIEDSLMISENDFFQQHDKVIHIQKNTIQCQHLCDLSFCSNPYRDIQIVDNNSIEEQNKQEYVTTSSSSSVKQCPKQSFIKKEPLLYLDTSCIHPSPLCSNQLNSTLINNSDVDDYPLSKTFNNLSFNLASSLTPFELSTFIRHQTQQSLKRHSPSYSEQMMYNEKDKLLIYSNPTSSTDLLPTLTISNPLVPKNIIPLNTHHLVNNTDSLLHNRVSVHPIETTSSVSKIQFTETTPNIIETKQKNFDQSKLPNHSRSEQIYSATAIHSNSHCPHFTTTSSSSCFEYHQDISQLFHTHTKKPNFQLESMESLNIMRTLSKPRLSATLQESPQLVHSKKDTVTGSEKKKGDYSSSRNDQPQTLSGSSCLTTHNPIENSNVISSSIHSNSSTSSLIPRKRGRPRLHPTTTTIKKSNIPSRTTTTTRVSSLLRSASKKPVLAEKKFVKKNDKRRSLDPSQNSIEYLRRYDIASIPIERYPNGLFNWVDIRVNRPQWTFSVDLNEIDDDNTIHLFHSSMNTPDSTDSTLPPMNDKINTIITHHPIIQTHIDSSQTKDTILQQKCHNKHWTYVDDSLDVAGFDEALKLPSSLARDVRFLRLSFQGINPSQEYCRYNERYAAQRELSLTKQKAYFFPTDVNTTLLKMFNIIDDAAIACTELNSRWISHNDWCYQTNSNTTQSDINLQTSVSSQISQDHVNSLIPNMSQMKNGDITPSVKPINYTNDVASSILPDHTTELDDPSEISRQLSDTSYRRLFFSTSLKKENVCKQSESFYFPTIPQGLARTDDIFRLWGTTIKEGDMIRVLFLQYTTLTTGLEEEEFQWFKLGTLSDTLSKVCEIDHTLLQRPDLTTVHLARYAPTLFWNLVFRFECDSFQIRQYLSQFTGRTFYGPSLRVRRRPRRDSKCDTSITKSRRSLISDKIELFHNQSNQRHTSSHQHCKSQTNNKEDTVYQSVKLRAAERTLLWSTRPRRLCRAILPQSPNALDGFIDPSDILQHHLYASDDLMTLSSRRERRVVLPDNPELLVEAYLDIDGFPKKSLSLISLSQRMLIYGCCCLNQWTAPLEIKVNEKGRAVYAAKDIDKDDFLCEYTGEFIQLRGIAKLRETQYEAQGLGSYMFYFKNPYTGTMSCVDATDERVDYGPARFINHSHLHPNCFAMAIRAPIQPQKSRKPDPKLVFIAKRNIRAQEELLIDYGETNPMVLKANPWLVNT